MSKPVSKPSSARRPDKSTPRDGHALNLTAEQTRRLQEVGAKMAERSKDLIEHPERHEWFDGQMVLDTYRENNYKSVGMLVFRRKQAGLTQAELGKRLGVPQSQISRIEKDPDRTSLGMLKRIAAVLGVPVRELV